MEDGVTESVDQSQNEVTSPTVDLDAIQKSLMDAFDKRLRGFQGLMDQREEAFRRELEQLKTASLSPEEQEQLQSSKAEQELAAARRELELLRMRRDYPEEVDLLDDFFKKQSLQDQLILLSEFRKAKAEAEAQGEPTTENQPTPVDKNNPARKNQVSLAEMAEEMSDDLADKVLASANEKGFLRRLRGG